MRAAALVCLVCLVNGASGIAHKFHEFAVNVAYLQLFISGAFPCTSKTLTLAVVAVTVALGITQLPRSISAESVLNI